MKLIIT